MNSVLLEDNDKQLFLLDEETSIHLNEVVKVKKGDKLKGTLLNKGLVELEVVSVDKRIEVKIMATKKGLYFPIEFIVGASRPPTMKKVIEHGSSMGISSFHILKAELSEKSYLQSKIYNQVEFDKLAGLGLSQSAVFFKRPVVNKHYSLDASKFNSHQKFILSPYADNHIKDVEIDINKPSVFAIGPERGWTVNEVENFKKNGFQEIKISPSILRVENATIALLGYLNQLM